VPHGHAGILPRSLRDLRFSRHPAPPRGHCRFLPPHYGMRDHGAPAPAGNCGDHRGLTHARYTYLGMGILGTLLSSQWPCDGPHGALRRHLPAHSRSRGGPAHAPGLSSGVLRPFPRPPAGDEHSAHWPAGQAPPDKRAYYRPLKRPVRYSVRYSAPRGGPLAPCWGTWPYHDRPPTRGRPTFPLPRREGAPPGKVSLPPRGTPSLQGAGGARIPRNGKG
jgi:hypothetical protein